MARISLHEDTRHSDGAEDSDATLSSNEGWAFPNWYTYVVGWAFRRANPTGRLRKQCCVVKEWLAIKRPDWRYRYSAEAGYNQHTTNNVRPSRRPARSTPSVALYPYHQLASADQIRIFELDPGNATAPLSGRLVVIDLKAADPFEYEAVSHVWGETEAFADLRCDANRMCITTRMEEMLRRLRWTDRARHLWIDVMCINQSDLAERKAQVSIMGTVYRKAKMVIIWLGEEDTGTADAFNLLEDAYTASERRNGMTETPPTMSKLLEAGFPTADDSRWPAFQALLLRPWFTRTWILQEVTLAQEARVHCGRHWCYWHQLAQVLLELHFSAISRALKLNIFWAVNVVMVGYYTFHENRSNKNLLHLMYTTKGTGLSDARDRVYALIGLADDGPAFEPMVDYGKTVADVYVDVTASYLTKPDDDLMALHYASDSAWRHEQSLPSWAPDFHPITAQVASALPPTCGKRPPPCSCDARRTISSRKILTIKGVIKTSVSGTGRHCQIYLDQRIISDAFRAFFYLEQWRHMAKKLKKYPTGESTDEAFARTIIAQAPKSQSGSTQGMSEVYHTYLKQFRRRLDAASQHEDDPFAATFWYHDMMRYICMRRTFFVTRNGYMGMGPYFMRPDDLVVRLHGACMPFIIRKLVNGHYRLVGEAYVHGMMELEECSTQEWQELELE